MRRVSVLIKAVLAGACIGIGGIVYLSLDNKMVGAFCFAVGLYIICTQSLNLFTGKVGYLVNNDRDYLIDLGIIWLGNLVGTYLTSFMVLQTRVGAKLASAGVAICEAKIADSYLSLFILGIFCGILMFAAVDGYKKCNNPLIIFFCVAVFILCGFEHCVADMVYVSLGSLWSVDMLIRILIISLGNSLGGILIPLANKFEK